MANLIGRAGRSDIGTPMESIGLQQSEHPAPNQDEWPPEAATPSAARPYDARSDGGVLN